MNYNIDVWIKVLETLEYKIGDELSAMGSDINILPAGKFAYAFPGAPAVKSTIDIYFNYKTGIVQSVFFKYDSQFPSDRTITKDNFINDYKDLFREAQLDEILK
jgi:hypothetical protein